MKRRTLFLLPLSLMLVTPQWASCNDSEAAQNLARGAALAGMMGDFDRRDELIESALDVDPNNALANWTAGRVATKGGWLATDDYEEQMQTHPMLQEYEQRRQAYRDGEINELQLADWCQKNNMPGREKLHLTNIWRSETATSDQRLAAAQRLGLRRAGGVWMSPEEMRTFQQSIQSAKRDAARWRQETRNLIRVLESGQPERRKYAIGAYRKAIDRSAVLTIESLLSPQGERYALLAVSFLGEISNQEATESLARHAVYAPSEKVRKAAIEQMKERDQQDTVPPLLALLSNPLEAKFGVYVTPDGMVRRRHQVTERGREADVQHVADSGRSIHGVNVIRFAVDSAGRLRSVGNSDDVLVARSLENREFDSIQEAQLAEQVLRQQLAIQRQRLVQQEFLRAIGLNQALQLRNERAGVVNERAMAALGSITNHRLDSATSWWDWWNEENDRYQSEHPTYTRYTAVSDPTLVRMGPMISRPRITRPLSCECFPAGTSVRTQTGARAIETIQVGDQVLSRDTGSGELAYKLVLGTTLRPPADMVTVQFQGHRIESTNGHLFWVEEHGWRMAKNLQPGDRLHGLDRSHAVVAVETRPGEAAHNLIVADFGTYFVGPHEILAHDNSERRRSDSITPGVRSVHRN